MYGLKYDLGSAHDWRSSSTAVPAEAFRIFGPAVRGGSVGLFALPNRLMEGCKDQRAGCRRELPLSHSLGRALERAPRRLLVASAGTGGHKSPQHFAGPAAGGSVELGIPLEAAEDREKKGSTPAVWTPCQFVLEARQRAAHVDSGRHASSTRPNRRDGLVGKYPKSMAEWFPSGTLLAVA